MRQPRFREQLAGRIWSNPLRRHFKGGEGGPNVVSTCVESLALVLTRYSQFFLLDGGSLPPDCASRCVKSLARVLMLYFQAFCLVATHFRQILQYLNPAEPHFTPPPSPPTPLSDARGRQTRKLRAKAGRPCERRCGGRGPRSGILSPDPLNPGFYLKYLLYII